jgi:hypothetical protein
MVRLLNLVGMEIQRYYGGSLSGMDPNKLIVDASIVIEKVEKIPNEERNQN